MEQRLDDLRPFRRREPVKQRAHDLFLSAFSARLFMRGDEMLDFVEVFARNVVCIKQALNHWCERAVEGVFERVEQFTALRLLTRDGGAVKCEVANLLRRE